MLLQFGVFLVENIDDLFIVFAVATLRRYRLIAGRLAQWTLFLETGDLHTKVLQIAS
jgi:hypothetical protein